MGFLRVVENFEGQFADVLSPARLTVVVVTALDPGPLVEVEEDVVLVVLELVVVVGLEAVGVFFDGEETAK